MLILCRLCNERASLHGSCDDAQRTYNPSNWTMLDYKIDYCLSRKTEPHCKLQFSIYIMIPVIICNLLKVLSMSWTLFRQRESTFVTFGDALASWLDDPDTPIKDICLMGKSEVIAMQKSQQHSYSAGMLFTAFLMGFRKLPSYMPIAGSCSAAIAAAAHRPKSDVNTSVLPVKWGAIADAETEGSRHACFTSEDAIELQDGKVYA